jgi:hypothetical protein
VDNALVAKKRIVLHLAGVSFIDSAGLGCLVRIFSRLRNDGGGLKLCEISPAVQKALQVTHLHAVMPAYESERHAVEAFGRLHERQQASQASPTTKIICVDDSFDVLAYMNALLTQAGYEVFPTRHVTDARTLAIATRPRVLVIGPSVQCNPAIIEAIRHSVHELHVVTLPPDFSTDDPSNSGAELVSRVHSFASAKAHHT